MLEQDLNQLLELEHPQNPLILKHGQSMTLRVQSFRKGKMLIKTTDAPEGKWIAAVRIFGPRLDKPSHAPWHDLTTSRLIATIEPYLESNAFSDGVYRITAQGAGVRKTFNVQVSPGAAPPPAERFA